MENERVLIATDRATLREVLSEIMKPDTPTANQTDFETEKFDRRKAAKFLGVSYQTMCNWTKWGWIKEHGQGRKKFYLRAELIDAMKNKG